MRGVVDKQTLFRMLTKINTKDKKPEVKARRFLSSKALGGRLLGVHDVFCHDIDW